MIYSVETEGLSPQTIALCSRRVDAEGIASTKLDRVTYVVRELDETVLEAKTRLIPPRE